jgi:hypothetical protein
MAVSVPLQDLESGMVLAEPVFNRWGQILLNKGCKLTPRHLAVLKTWGVPKVFIGSGERDEDLPRVDEATLNRARGHIKKRMLWHPETTLEKEIIQLAIQQAAKRYWHQGLERSGAEVVSPKNLSAPDLKRPGSQRTA